ncbi:MAG: hypothetical protein QOH79_1652 [Acidimicrobiaceae bacterium]
MTAPAGRDKRQARSALAGAAITLLAIALLGLISSTPSNADPVPCTPVPSCDSTTSTLEPTTVDPSTSTTTPSEWEGSTWTGPVADGDTVSDGTFSGTFVHQPSTPGISTVDLTVTYSAGNTPSPDCGPAPGAQPTHAAPSTSTSTPSGEPSRVNFLFEVAFTCNGLYDATATATLDGPPSEFSTHPIELNALRVAVPPEPPASLLATDNGNQSVTLSWQPPTVTSPDLAGYRLSRRTDGSQTFDVVVDVGTATLTVNDTNVPTSGASYFYKVETLRKSPNGNLTSSPVVTSAALVVAGGTGGGGRSVGGVPAARTSGGASHFDEPSTLVADEGEPGSGDFAVPGGATIQRFAGREGAGLVKPFAAALDLAVWAGLLLFLTRRAKSAERALSLELELEHST